MATQLIKSGEVTSLTQNVVFALPSKRCLLFTDATTPTIQQSTDVAFTANAAVTLTGGQAELAGAFIRCTSATISVIVKVQ